MRRSAIVPSSCERMFALVDEVERYPEFLPWCSSTALLERTAEVTSGRIDVDYRGLKMAITTLNRKEPPRRMTLELVEGPFERFAGEWRFAPLGTAGCRVELRLDYVMSSRAANALLAPLFGHIAETLVESFVRRAEAPGARS